MIIDKIRNLEENISTEIQQLSQKIYERPELGMEEFYAASLHKKLLLQHGFILEENLCGIETAFSATFDGGEGPALALMAEYDALPGIGHGCGHNILGASSTGAAIVVRYLAEEVGGKITLFGTPAEETSGVKVDMVREGLLAGYDAAFMAHPAPNYKISTSSLALKAVAFDFHGKSAHAASYPWKGVNALDASILTFNGVSLLRQQMEPTARIHGIIKEGGEAANIIPDYSRSEFYVRAPEKGYMLELYDKVVACAEAAAKATGCTLKLDHYEKAYDNLVTNERMNSVFVEAIQTFTEDEIIMEPSPMGSLDMGNVSHALPAIHGYFPIADHYITSHSREFAESTITDYAQNKLDEIICILSLLGYRMLTEEHLMEEIKSEYQQAVVEGKIIPPGR